jgi:Protein of unknown function (DUF2934)
MNKETVLNRATPTMSAGSSRVSPTSEKAGSAEQTSKGAWAHDRIARRAYELYEQGGRQDGRALEDWFNAERQLVGAASHS